MAAFRLRRERDRSVLTTLLDLSSRWNAVASVGFIFLAIGGLVAAWNANLLTAPWVVWSYVVLIVVLVAMFAIASPFYYGLRDAVAGAKGRMSAGRAYSTMWRMCRKTSAAETTPMGRPSSTSGIWRNPPMAIFCTATAIA